MSRSAEPVGGVALLTRTTLLIARALAAPAMTQVIEALQRVPGVLLAESNREGNRAIVSHDAGVPTASLLEATSRLGVNAVIVDGAPVVSANPAKTAANNVRIRRLLIAAVVACVMLALAEALVLHI